MWSPAARTPRRMYLQGASSSLPEDVQNAFYRSIKGFEHIEIMRPAYAIEYDCVDPTSLEATLESKVVRGLYGAGQFNGTSGYEEAAAQGLLAGLNAARNALGKEQLILPRHTSYLGTLVDDLVTKGVMDPYRMMTSRSEYRLTLRQDNADQRLTPIGREYGLVQDDRWAKYQHTQSILEAERRRLHETHLRTADLRTAMEAAGLAPCCRGRHCGRTAAPPGDQLSAAGRCHRLGRGDHPHAGRTAGDRDQVCGLHCPAGPDDPGRGPA